MTHRTLSTLTRSVATLAMFTALAPGCMDLTPIGEAINSMDYRIVSPVDPCDHGVDDRDCVATPSGSDDRVSDLVVPLACVELVQAYDTCIFDLGEPTDVLAECTMPASEATPELLATMACAADAISEYGCNWDWLTACEPNGATEPGRPPAPDFEDRDEGSYGTSPDGELTTDVEVACGALMELQAECWGLEADAVSLCDTDLSDPDLASFYECLYDEAEATCHDPQAFDLSSCSS